MLPLVKINLFRMLDNKGCLWVFICEFLVVFCFTFYVSLKYFQIQLKIFLLIYIFDVVLTN